MKRAIERSKLDRETNIELVETMWKQFSNLGIYELNVIDTTTHSIKDTVSAVQNVHGVMHLYSVNPVQILFLLCDFHKKYILCVLKLAAVSASHCTLVIKAILTNLFTKTLYISNIELYLANF